MSYQTVQIGDLALDEPGSFKIGPFGSSLKKDELVSSGIPVIGIENILPNEFVPSYRKYITEKKYQDLSQYTVKPGDIAVTTMGTIGRAAVILENIGTAIIDSHLFRMRVDQAKVYPPYLCYAINGAPSVINHLEQYSRGAIMDGLNTTILKESPLALPPLTEQKRIASLLARADRLRSLRRTARDLGESLLQSVFLEMFGEYLNKVECQFGDVLEIPLTNGFFEKNDKYGKGNPVVWVDNLYHTNIIDTRQLRRVQVSEKELDKYEVLEGDLLFTRSSLVADGVGQANIVSKLEERTMFESHVIRARVDKKKVNPFYALGLFRSQFGKTEIMKRAKTATMTTIGQDTLYEFPCPIPPLNLQEEFASVVRRVEQMRARQAEGERQAQGLFESLLALSFVEGLSEAFEH